VIAVSAATGGPRVVLRRAFGSRMPRDDDGGGGVHRRVLPPKATIKGGQSKAYNRASSHSPPLVRMLALLPAAVIQLISIAAAVAALLVSVARNPEDPMSPLVLSTIAVALVQDLKGLTSVPNFETLADKTILPVLLVKIHLPLIIASDVGASRQVAATLGMIAVDAVAGSRMCPPCAASRYHQIVGVALLSVILIMAAETTFRPTEPNLIPAAAVPLVAAVRSLMACGTIFSALIADDTAVDPSADAPATDPPQKKSV